MLTLANLSISTRFMLVLALGAIFQAGISLVSLMNLKHSLIEARTSEVKHLLETAYSTVVFYHGQASRGVISDDQARQAAKDAVRAMHYDNGNYFFIWTMNGTGVAHGSHPEWEGRTVVNSPDATRLPIVSYMVRQLIEACKSAKKEGVATYKIPRAGQTEPLDKIAYTRLFEPWGWSIGTGAYVDDIDATFWSEAVSILWVFIGLIALAGVLTFLVGRDLARALNRLSGRVASVADGEFEGDVPEIGRGDEVGVMARALLVLRDNSRDAVELRHDHLTGLPNRRLMLDRLKQAMAASSRSGHYGGLMLIDMDKFKTLNDTQGHDVGDMLLREVAQRLTACIRQCDTVARLGGDEFVVVVVDIGHNERDAAKAVEIVGEKVLSTLSQVYHLGTVTHNCSASVGLTLFCGETVTVDTLLKQADLAMYKSKDTGRNACRFFDPHMEAMVHERAELERDMRQGISENQFLLHYQGQVGADGHLKGAEVLLRWNHPNRGLVLPAAFIAAAEETGLILPLGQWVLETACKQLALWATNNRRAEIKLAVNVSPRQFQQPDFVAQVISILDRTLADSLIFKTQQIQYLSSMPPNGFL